MLLRFRKTYVCKRACVEAENWVEETCFIHRFHRCDFNCAPL